MNILESIGNTPIVSLEKLNPNPRVKVFAKLEGNNPGGYDTSIQIIAAEPILGHKIQGLKNMAEAIVPAIFDPSKLDEKHVVEDDAAFEMTRRLALQEGLFMGMSSGAAIYVALKKARELKDGTIVVILPDRGDRYLSTSLFASVCAECPP